tara:strand:+ start:1663 stop:2061 length:399 start_codon:yes stop_codon:yes gene_type:complete
MKMIAKILFGILGILLVFLIVWFGMPNVQNIFKEVKIISVTVKLDNKCTLDDDTFVVAVPGTDIIVPFRNKIARLRLKSDRKIQLIANPKYTAIKYDGMFEDVKKNVVLEADCTTSPRLKGIFKSMKDQFKN